MTRLIRRAAIAFGGSLGLTAIFLTGVASADVNGNTNYSSQQGVQTSTSVQSAVILSGAATSADNGTATSGAATAATTFSGNQTLTLTQHNQSDMGGALTISGNTNGSADVPTIQSAMNGLNNQQQNGAQSGDAAASGSGISLTGALNSQLANTQVQLQELLQATQSIFPAP